LAVLSSRAKGFWSSFGAKSARKRGKVKRLSHHLSLFHVSLLALGVVATAASADSSSYPSSTIRIVEAGAAGTPPDIVSRIVAAELAEAEGWRVIVENKSGAMQTLAAAEVLNRPADGYSIFTTSLPGMVAPALIGNVGYRLDIDFAPVIKLSTSYNVLVVHPSVPARSLSELVALMRSEPDALRFSSGGFGTPAHLAGELFKLRSGVRATHVPYPTALPRAIADLLSGVNQFQFVTTLPVLDLIAAGRLRALAVTAPKRLAAFEHVPTVVEEGFPELIIEAWAGCLVKRGTPENIVIRLNEAINKVLGKPSVGAAFAKLGAEPAGGTAAEFGDFVSSQLAYWAKVVKESGIKMHQ
jgi:tripartite-type tricarboxylate transporter receptor subunit TctC